MTSDEEPAGAAMPWSTAITLPQPLACALRDFTAMVPYAATYDDEAALELAQGLDVLIFGGHERAITAGVLRNAYASLGQVQRLLKQESLFGPRPPGPDPQAPGVFLDATTANVLRLALADMAVRDNRLLMSISRPLADALQAALTPRSAPTGRLGARRRQRLDRAASAGRAHLHATADVVFGDEPPAMLRLPPHRPLRRAVVATQGRRGTPGR